MELETSRMGSLHVACPWTHFPCPGHVSLEYHSTVTLLGGGELNKTLLGGIQVFRASSQPVPAVYTGQLLLNYPAGFTKLPNFCCRRLGQNRIEDLPLLSSVSDYLVQKQVLQQSGDPHR